MAEVGDIFVAIWGYDQTNADFFQVIAKTNKGVKVRHIKNKQEESPAGSMSGYATPIKDDFDGPLKSKKLAMGPYGEYFNAGDSMGTAKKWGGNPVAVSWYA